MNVRRERDIGNSSRIYSRPAFQDTTIERLQREATCGKLWQSPGSKLEREQSSRAAGKMTGVGYGGIKKPPPTSGLLQQGKSQPASLRQQSGKGGGGAASSRTQNPSIQATALRANHLLRIATWASANVPPLGALLGARLGCLCESAGVPVPDTPHVICERCESIMQVGVNCSVRVIKNKRKGKSSNISNYVTYICHFCKHGNAKPGTSKNHLKTKIAQAAARSSLNLLGKPPVAETRPVDKQRLPLNFKQETELAPVKDERSVQIRLENQRRSTEQGGPEVLEATLINKKPLDVALEGYAEQEGSVDVELSLRKGLSNLMETSQLGLDGLECLEAVEMNEHLNLREEDEQGFAEQEGAKSVEGTNHTGPLIAMERKQMESAGQGCAEVTFKKSPLDAADKDQREQESGNAVEVIIGQRLSDLMEMNQQGFTQQEDSTTVQGDLGMGLLDHSGKKEQGFVEQVGLKTVEVILSKGTLEHSGKNERVGTEPEDLKSVEVNLSKETLENARKNEQGFAELEGLKSTGMGLYRLPLDLSSKKKRKKKNQQFVIEQEGPKLSSHEGPAVDSRDSAKKKKRKGWSTLKELAILP